MHRSKENESQSELMLFDNLSDAPNNTSGENELSDNSKIFELSDVLKQRRRLNKSYNIIVQAKVKIRRHRLMSL